MWVFSYLLSCSRPFLRPVCDLLRFANNCNILSTVLSVDSDDTAHGHLCACAMPTTRYRACASIFG